MSIANSGGLVEISVNAHIMVLNKIKINSYLSAKSYVLGTRKNHLNEMVLLSTQNKCLNILIR